MECGIYLILNRLNGKKYVGSSKSLPRRKYEHWANLKRGVHNNPHLQAAWDSDGEDAFLFEVLEYCPLDERVAREKWWVEALDLYHPDRGYNLRRVDKNPMEGRKHSAETRAKMTAAHTGKKKTPEQIEAMRARLTGRKLSPEHVEGMKGRSPWNKGKSGVYSEEAKAAMAAAKAGKPLSPEHREKVLAAIHPDGATWNKGKSMPSLSDECKAKISAGVMAADAWRGRTHTAASRARMAEAHRGKKLTAEHRAKISAALIAAGGTRGRPVSEETKAKQAAAKRGRPWSAARRAAFEKGCST